MFSHYGTDMYTLGDAIAGLPERLYNGSGQLLHSADSSSTDFSCPTWFLHNTNLT